MLNPTTHYESNFVSELCSEKSFVHEMFTYEIEPIYYNMNAGQLIMLFLKTSFLYLKYWKQQSISYGSRECKNKTKFEVH